MSHSERRALTTSFAKLVAGVALGAFVASTAVAQVLPPHPNAPKPNWAAFDKYSAATMRGMIASTNINPRWIGESDSVFYSWSDRTGDTWFLVNSATRQKKPLFDHVKLAAQLSELRRRAIDPKQLLDNSAMTMVNITKDHKNIRFNSDSGTAQQRYNWNLATEKLTVLGRYRGTQDSTMTKDEEMEQGGGGGGRGGGGRGGRGNAAGAAPGAPATPPDFRNWSPDSTAFVFTRNYNLYLYEKSRNDTTQITTDGIREFSWGGGGAGGRGGGQQDSTQQQQQQDDGGRGAAAANANRNTRANVTWSGDSKSFYLTRTDTRGIEQRSYWLVRNLVDPHIDLMTYSYVNPGDPVARPNYYSYTRGDKSAKIIPVTKWKDQQYQWATWVGKDGTKFRIGRRDRLQRNLEYLEVDIPTGAVKVLVSETKGDFGSLETNGPTYLKGFGADDGAPPAPGATPTGPTPGSDFVWWSERSGWGHLYLYSWDGTLKRQLTSGDWRANPGLVAYDSVKNVGYVRGQGREPGENLYHQHLYRVDLNTGAMTLLDPGNANHQSQVSSNKRYVVDMSSRVDTVPRVQLRDGLTGKLVMDLQEADLSSLVAYGWKYPTTFQTLAADGVTPIFGNMWKPFDFDSTKKYPIIANVYPGPQQEAVGNAFAPAGNQQQLAQLGFIVIQIGNRGGTPARSAAYQDFSYYNMRDYALADKKAGIEQLAAKYKWIDIDRVGIYGHSGGGFLTGAALLLPPFNEFFKVGVSESGNHDNNIYNSNWSEQYHGLKWVAAADTARLTAEARAKGRNSEFTAGQAVAATQLGSGGRGGGGGRGGVGGGGRGGGGGGNGRGGGGAGRGAGGGAAGGQDPAATPGDPVKPDSAFWIYVPTNIDLAANLKGKLLLETGDEDNNVHPANTIRLVNALIQNNKRFDYMIYPGQAHAFGPMSAYAWQMQAEYFVEFLLGDNTHRRSADFTKHGPGQ